METENLLMIIIILLILVLGELTYVSFFALKRLEKKGNSERAAELIRESAAVVRERKPEAQSGRLKQKSEGGSGRLKPRTEATPRIQGLRICPRCYTAVNNECDECPACKNPLR